MKNNECLVYPCACASNLGQLAVKVALELEKNMIASYVQLPDPLGDDKEFINTAKAAKLNIAVDGCKSGCAKKELKTRKIKQLSFCLTDYGCILNETPVSDETVNNLFNIVKQKIGEQCA